MALAQLLANAAPDERATHAYSACQRERTCRGAGHCETERREGRPAEHDQPNRGSRLGADQCRHDRARREFGLIGAGSGHRGRLRLYPVQSSKLQLRSR